MNPRIILASASPRRAELLRQLGLVFDISPPAQDDPEDVAPEAVAPGTHLVRAAETAARRLAEAKAAAVGRLAPDAVVIGADTIVVAEDGLLGKPQAAAEAREMLRQLSGCRHDVVTGVAVVHERRNLHLVDSSTTAVWFRTLTEDEITRYVATGEPLDKAGAYGIQGKAAVFVDRVDGDYFTVVGLPLARLAALLQRAGVPVI